MNIQFTAHNIRLDNGTFTKPQDRVSMEHYSQFISAKRLLETIYPDNRHLIRLADLGCLEGGYAVEFARMGFQVIGIEVRESNIAACQYVKENTSLPNLQFIRDDAKNIEKYGVFDVIFCCGLLYHFDKPKEFLSILSNASKTLVILQTHFAPSATSNGGTVEKFKLSSLTENEGLSGRWVTEFKTETDFANREAAKWSSWDNCQSFWIQREYLLQAIQDVGFDLVMEQYDELGERIAESMLEGDYNTYSRGTFIGIKTKKAMYNSLTSDAVPDFV